MLAVQNLLNDLQTKEPPKPKDPGLMTMDDVSPFITAEQKHQYQREFKVSVQHIQMIHILGFRIILVGLQILPCLGIKLRNPICSQPKSD